MVLSLHLRFKTQICCRALLPFAFVCVWYLTAENTQAQTAQSPELPDRWMQVSKSVYSSARPKELAEFQAVAARGIQIIVSVDAGLPDVNKSRQAGIRYVHIPIGYSGVNEHARKSLIQLAKETKGPWLVHCHHGQHRGPTMAALLAIVCKEIDGQKAETLMRHAGTDPDFVGLWRSIEQIQQTKPTHLPLLFEQVQSNDIATAMASISDLFKALEEPASQESGSHVPGERTPRQHALLLKEEFRELARSERASKGDKNLVDWFQDMERLATDLHSATADGNEESQATLLSQIKDNCQKCHETYR